MTAAGKETPPVDSSRLNPLTAAGKETPPVVDSSRLNPLRAERRRNLTVG